MDTFPAVLIGGPPHAGKSVLAYSLTQALRRAGIRDHYVLRAYPDGEGDWSQQTPPETVRLLRVKGQGTPAWIAHVCDDIARRHLPLLVDVGGRPASWQETLFDYCTHAILLTLDPASRGEWLAMMARHNVSLLADLHSTLEGTGQVEACDGVLRGTLVGLHRHAMASGPAFDALLDRLARLLHRPESELRRHHLDTSPVELTIELDRLKRTLGIGGDPETWEPGSLPQVLDYLPERVPLGLYGRAPNWLYAALALLAHPARLVQFDPRLGWVAPAPVMVGDATDGEALCAAARPQPGWTLVSCSLPQAYIDYLDAQDLRVPRVPHGRGVVLSGKVPHWLLTGIALAYQHAPWIGVYQPQVGGAVIVHARSGERSPGEVVGIPHTGQPEPRTPVQP